MHRHVWESARVLHSNRLTMDGEFHITRVDRYCTLCGKTQIKTRDGWWSLTDVKMLDKKKKA